MMLSVFRKSKKGLRFLLILMLWGCGGNDLTVVDGGSGTNTGNSLTAAYRFENGDPAAYAQVSIRPSGYLKTRQADSGVTVYDFITNRQGEFTINEVPQGEYNIEVYDNNDRAVLQNIAIDSDTTQYVLNVATLTSVGKISGKINLPESNVQVYVQLVGTIHSAQVDQATEKFEISNVPQGNYQLMAFSPEEESISETQWEVKVEPKEESVLNGINLENYENWQHSKVLILKALAESNFNALENYYPLLLQLNSRNFDFSEAKEDGSDFRILDSEGVLAKYKIESWDATNSRAAIWLHISNISAFSVGRSFTLYWGNPLAEDKSDPESVFSEESYQAVWQFSQSMGDSISDASASNNNGALQNASGGDVSIDGLAGKGYELNGENQYMTSTQVQWNPNVYTISVWFKTETQSGGRLIGLSNPQIIGGLHKNGERQIWMSNDGRLNYGVFNDSLTLEEWYLLEQDSIAFKDKEFDDTHRQIISGTNVVNDGQWHLAAATLSSEGMKLYLDGELEISDGRYTYGSAREGYWVLGSGILGGWDPHPRSIYFEGILDEARVEYIAHSDAYIKLMYMNLMTPENVYTLE